jgi:hypothetical protein
LSRTASAKTRKNRSRQDCQCYRSVVEHFLNR